MSARRPPSGLTNQSVVRFQSGGYSGQSYSNLVHTPVIGPYLTLEKEAEPARAMLGQTLTYRLRLRNTGNAAAEVALFDKLPEGTSYVANSVTVDGIPQAAAHPQSGIRLGTVLPGEEVLASFQVLLFAFPPGGRLANQARAVYSFRVPDGRLVHGEAQSSLSVVEVERVRVAVIKTVTPAEALVGDTVTYRISILNDGSLPIRSVVLTDTLSPFAEFVPGSVTADRVFLPGASPLQGIALGTIAPGASVEVTFRVRVAGLPAPPYEIASQAAVEYTAGTGSRGVAYSNEAAAVVLAPAVTLDKSVDRTSATAGDRLRYHLLVKNTGNAVVEALLTDAVPPGSLFVLGSVQVNGRTLEGAHPASGVPLGPLQPGSWTAVTFESTVTAVHSPPLRELLSNQGEVGYTLQLGQGRVVRQSAISNAAVTRLLLPILTVSASAAPSSADPGDLITVRVRITNSGNTAAAVQLRDLIPLGAEYVEGSLRWMGGGGTGRTGTVPPFSSVEIVYLLRILRHPHRTWIKGRIRVPYEYAVNETLHTGRAESDDFFISLDPGME
ncbi:hypothetical protein [Paenibacillus sp. KR2-11]|uniref:hypothetical protein n=1 Tax=Paenibacillus sp. KR2-11 TaxID=3385500 RepID=UPI0038FCC01B